MIAQLLGFAPDADPTVPGVLTNASGVVPTLKGAEHFLNWIFRQKGNPNISFIILQP